MSPGSVALGGFDATDRASLRDPVASVRSPRWRRVLRLTEMVELTGIEPATSWLQTQALSQLSYSPVGRAAVQPTSGGGRGQPEGGGPKWI